MGISQANILWIPMNQPGFCRTSFRGFEHCSNGFGKWNQFLGFAVFFLTPRNTYDFNERIHTKYIKLL